MSGCESRIRRKAGAHERLVVSEEDANAHKRVGPRGGCALTSDRRTSRLRNHGFISGDASDATLSVFKGGNRFGRPGTSS